MSVRKSPPPSGPGMAVAKRARVEDEGADEGTMTLTVASSGEGQRKNALVRTIKRTSGLEAPIVSLTGAHGVSGGGRVGGGLGMTRFCLPVEDLSRLQCAIKLTV